MRPVHASDWQAELGLTDREPPFFFRSEDQLTATSPQPHALRRAFELLELNGVLCTENAPLVYFKLVSRIALDDIRVLYRKFWNHGGAPLLVIISTEEVQIYSALQRPRPCESPSSIPSGLVTSIKRASVALKELLPTVESGEFFRRHSQSFKVSERVDHSLLNNLSATRDKLAPSSHPGVLDSFLCRLVFTCYLFDRGVVGGSYLEDIGLRGLVHLRDILGLRPHLNAKDALYRLFRRLAGDFNGDLFNANLEAEANVISPSHIETVDAFFRGTDITTGLGSFWPYDFEAIPIETISAIYERFLNADRNEKKSFYTPPFLAELVLDIALLDRSSLLQLRILDPACGSGIFLVGLFNRMAEEWKRANPRARNDRRARELMDLMQSGIFGIDSDPTACRIAAFSLYLAYLDQLSPRDIQALQAKGRVLPSLIADPAVTGIKPQGGTIWCGDFFATDCSCPCDVDLVVGNPPWGSIAGEGTLAAIWLAQNGLSVPDGQIAAAFIWKAPRHISSNGRVCLVLPHGILFNHSDAALDFQRSFIQTHSVERVLNLTDFQSFLFSKARHPALVIAYRAQKPAPEHCITYWAPKADWKALKVEIITISENDRSRFPQRAVVDDLHSPDAPQIWKRMSWATPRDRRLLDRLSDYPRLRDRVRQARDGDFDKTWLIAEGFQPLGPNDDPERAKVLSLPSDLFIPANSPHLDLFLLPEDCIRLDTPEVKVRARSNKRTEIFHSPHVIVAKGFGRIAFADFPVSFQHALRGITGPAADRDLLIFLTAYLQSAVVRYFQFHTSSNWGVSRNEVHVEELLRLPFPLPNGAEDSSGFRSSIVAKVVQVVELAAEQAANSVLGREEVKRQAHAHVEELMYDYFDVIPSEQILIRDTVEMLAGSFRPGTRSQVIPAIAPTTVDARRMYVERLCATLNGWSRHGAAQVRGASTVSEDMGLGLVTLEKAQAPASLPGSPADLDLLVVLDKVRDAAMMRTNSFELTRGIKVFDGPRLYIVKPLEYRFWSGTAALNDADDIAGSILLQSEARLH